jgi:hypothetical protein
MLGNERGEARCERLEPRPLRFFSNLEGLFRNQEVRTKNQEARFEKRENRFNNQKPRRLFFVTSTAGEVY